MRKALLFAILGLLLLVGGLAVPSAPARSCGTAAAPGYHAIITSAKGVSCSSAKRAVQVWLDHKARPSGGPRGWRCSAKYAKLLWRCTRHSAVIRFTLHRYY
jgi:hypothetical protein